MTERPDLEDIVTALQREFDDADEFYGSEVWPETDAANRYYDAEPFGDEVEGRSQIVLPVVQEVITYMLASLERVFLSGDRVIEFEAVDEEDEKGAEEATDAIHYNFMREQDGSRVLGDWFQSGLLERIGVAKTVCETEEKVTRERVAIDEMQAVALDAGMLQLGEGEELEEVTDNGDGTFSATIKRTKILKRYIDVPVPLNEFRFARNTRHEDQSDYLNHCCLKTRSELVEMGFDRAQVDELPIASNLDGAVHAWRDWQNWRDVSDLPHELQTCLLHEEYARMDVDGDGIAERVKVFRVEDQILIDAETGEPSIETISEQPFAVFCPFPRAHRLIGHSLADKGMDLQRLESVTARQMQDGMYLANMPRPMIDMGSDYAATTVEDVMRPIAGSPIRYKNTPPQPYQSGLDVSKSLTVLEHWKAERETRTGITRLNLGIDTEALNKTAEGQGRLQAQGQQMEESIARRAAEAFGRLMAKKYRLMKAEGAQFPIKLAQPIKNPDGTVTKFGMADASRWPDEFRLIIRVGIGTGRKEQRIANLFALANIQERAYQVGAVNNAGLYRTGSEIVTAMGLGQGDDYFVDPAQQQQPESDPEADAANAELQAKMQLEMGKAAAKAQGDQLKAEYKLQGDRERQAQEAQLRREEMATEAQLAVLKMATDANTKASIDDTAPGGSLAR